MLIGDLDLDPAFRDPAFRDPAYRRRVTAFLDDESDRDVGGSEAERQGEARNQEPGIKNQEPGDHPRPDT